MGYSIKRIDTGNAYYVLYDVFFNGRKEGQINRSHVGFPEKVVWDWHAGDYGFGRAYRSKKHAIGGLMHYRGIK